MLEWPEGIDEVELTDERREEILQLLQQMREELRQLRESMQDELPARPTGKKVHVNMSDGAFLTILTSSVESYPSTHMGVGALRPGEGEVMGFLYGHTQEDEDTFTYHVVGASVMQSYIERDEASCSVSPALINKVRSITDAIPGLRCLGRFHSHPYVYSDFETEFCSHWSDTDLENTMASIEEYDVPPLEVIFALSYLNTAKRKAPVLKPSRIVNYCKRFKFVLRAFAVDAEYESLEDVDSLTCGLAKKIRN